MADCVTSTPARGWRPSVEAVCALVIVGLAMSDAASGIHFYQLIGVGFGLTAASDAVASYRSSIACIDGDEVVTRPRFGGPTKRRLGDLLTVEWHPGFGIVFNYQDFGDNIRLSARG